MGNPPSNDLATSRHGTVLESVEDLREQLSRPATSKERQLEGTATAQPGDALRFRPLLRPPMALLRVFDDGEDGGELVRIRKSPFVLGRVEGDLGIPHDDLISTKHAEISRRQEGGRFAWYLKDLGSMNGTFVRVTAGVLRPGQIVLIGGNRYQFVLAESQAANPVSKGTSHWQQLSAEAVARLQPALVELSVDGAGQRYPLTAGENWVGRDATHCTIVLDDPMVSHRHARIYSDARGRWCVENAKSVNGVWAQVDEVPLGNGGYFRCGEQRFAIRVM